MYIYLYDPEDGHLTNLVMGDTSCASHYPNSITRETLVENPQNYVVVDGILKLKDE